jgi:hypothetical protein
MFAMIVHTARNGSGTKSGMPDPKEFIALATVVFPDFSAAFVTLLGRCRFQITKLFFI